MSLVAHGANAWPRGFIGNRGPGATHAACVCCVVNVMFQPQARSSRERTCCLWYLVCVVFVLRLLLCCTLAEFKCDFFFDWTA